MAAKIGVELAGSAKNRVANAPHIIMIPTTSRTMPKRNFEKPFTGLYPPASGLFYTTLVIDSNTLPCYSLASELKGKANGRVGKSTSNGGSERRGL